MMHCNWKLSRISLALATMIGLGAWVPMPTYADDEGSGAVYTLGNDAGGNQLVVFQRDRNGSLWPPAQFQREAWGQGPAWEARAR